MTRDIPHPNDSETETDVDELTDEQTDQLSDAQVSSPQPDWEPKQRPQTGDTEIGDIDNGIQSCLPL
jgi:hypothetical protein